MLFQICKWFFFILTAMIWMAALLDSWFDGQQGADLIVWPRNLLEYVLIGSFFALFWISLFKHHLLRTSDTNFIHNTLKGMMVGVLLGMPATHLLGKLLSSSFVDPKLFNLILSIYTVLLVLITTYLGVHSRQKWRFKWARIIGMVLCQLFIVIFFFVPFKASYTIQGSYMNPLLDDGEQIWLETAHYNSKKQSFQHGDLLLYSVGGCSGTCYELVLGRVIAIPGDLVEITSKNQLEINGEVLTHSWIGPVGGESSSIGLWREKQHRIQYEIIDQVSGPKFEFGVWYVINYRRDVKYNHPTKRIIPPNTYYVCADNRARPNSDLSPGSELVEQVYAWRIW